MPTSKFYFFCDFRFAQEESKREGGSIEDKLKQARKAARVVKTELEGVEKDARKQEARNEAELKKARKKYGGVAKVAKRVCKLHRK